MKKLLVISSLITGCILLFSCEKVQVDQKGQNTNGPDINLFGGGGWCKPGTTPGGSTAPTNHQMNTTVGIHPGFETTKR